MVNNRNNGKSIIVEVPLPLFSEDDYSTSVPAAGNRNGSSLNNAGENGNYWSSTVNDDTNNANNLNFNKGNHNTNRNNRNNGFPVRPVSELTTEQPENCNRFFSILKETLLKDLLTAYKDARKHKRNRKYQLKFEINMEENLVALRDELLERRYIPEESDCFIIHDPKMREVFAAQFRDRIIHHLFYNYTYHIYAKTFIYDSYSCIEGRGTHFGIKRLKHHILSVSNNYQNPCFVLKIDLKGYFMSINRKILSDISLETLRKNKRHLLDGNGNPLDFEFVSYLLGIIINTDPTENCNIIGDRDEWNKLPKDKSLFTSKAGCGLPIGNLSSQLFSNIYLNRLDQYVKRILGCKHYGRYVDDAFIVHSDKAYLKEVLGEIHIFLRNELQLELNLSKTKIIDVRYGVDFLGAFIKPYRTYIANSTLRRIRKKLGNINHGDVKNLECSVNSFLGVFSHYRSYCIRKVLFCHNTNISDIGRFSSDMLKFKYHGQ